VVRPAGRLVRELAETVVLALAIFLLVRAVVQNFQVEGRSMEPTLETGWYLLVNKSLYWEVNLDTVGKFVPFVDGGSDPTRYIFRSPQRGDVVVFQQPDQPIGALERDFIKRIIGLPGEVVEVHDGTVFIDGEPLHEPYISEEPGYDCPARVVPEGSYFVLGDNRNNSSDSHSWGPVPKENIIGQAWLIYWPFETFGLVDNDHVKPDAEQAEAPRPVKEDVPLMTKGGCSSGV
jgi:signal peptidase I